MQKELFNIYVIDDQGFIFNKETKNKVSTRYNKKNNNISINLYVNRKKTTFIFHTLMAKAFVNGYNSKTDIIRHKDRDPFNNALSNLEVYRYIIIFPNNDN